MCCFDGILTVVRTIALIMSLTLAFFLSLCRDLKVVIITSLFQTWLLLNQTPTFSCVWWAWTELSWSSALWSFRPSCQQQRVSATSYSANIQLTPPDRGQPQPTSCWRQRQGCETSDCCVCWTCIAMATTRRKSFSTEHLQWRMTSRYEYFL